MVLALIAVSAEATARIDDFIFVGTPLLSNPDRQRDLVVQDEFGTRGRPGGVFERWRLNNFGFRGPDISRKPNSVRLVLLGASETFGLYESEGHDYPTLLQRKLRLGNHPDLEIVNAAMAGMALPSMTSYWTKWVQGFDAKAVLIYPSPNFYLDVSSPRQRPALQPTVTKSEELFRSRFLARLGKVLSRYRIIRIFRTQYEVSRFWKQNPQITPFGPEPNVERLTEFTEDLKSLARQVEHAGAVPILITPPFKTSATLAIQDAAEMEYFRIFYPRATAQGIASFNYEAQQAVRQLGREEGWQVIDAAAVLNGKRELFADPVHFNDKGSEVIAETIATEILKAPVYADKMPDAVQ